VNALKRYATIHQLTMAEFCKLARRARLGTSSSAGWSASTAAFWLDAAGEMRRKGYPRTMWLEDLRRARSWRLRPHGRQGVFSWSNPPPGP